MSESIIPDGHPDNNPGRQNREGLGFETWKHKLPELPARRLQVNSGNPASLETPLPIRSTSAIDPIMPLDELANLQQEGIQLYTHYLSADETQEHLRAAFVRLTETCEVVTASSGQALDMSTLTPEQQTAALLTMTTMVAFGATEAGDQRTASTVGYMMSATANNLNTRYKRRYDTGAAGEALDPLYAFERDILIGGLFIALSTYADTFQPPELV